MFDVFKRGGERVILYEDNSINAGINESNGTKKYNG
jgi:hypothetical protein